MYKQFSDSTSTNGIMSLTTYFCAALLLVSSSSAEIFNKSWWNNSILYQIVPSSFYDFNADGIGDYKEITSKLPYITDTGINAIWLSPIYSSAIFPMVNLESHLSNYTEVNLINTVDDFKALLAKAHKIGIKVILDIIINHTSDEHPWFQKALQGDEKYKGYYMWAEGKNKDNEVPPNNWLNVFSGPAWTYVDSQKQWYLHQYDRRHPDLNYSNPDVVQEIQNALEFFLTTGLDGFSVYFAPHIFEDKELRDEPRSYAAGVTSQDYSYLNHIYTINQKPTYELLRHLKMFMDRYADQHNEDEKVLMIEANTDFPHTIEYYNYDVLPFNFEFIYNVTLNSSAEYVKEEIDLWINSMPSGKVANWILGNQCNTRAASRFPGRLDQMTMLSMILPGMAVVCYGDEIGIVDGKDISWEDTQDPEASNMGKAHYAAIRNPVRTPFQRNVEKHAGFSTANSTRLPVNPNYKELNLEKEMNSNESHYKIYKLLAYLHQNEPALTKGGYTSFTTNNGAVLGVIRKYGSRSVVLLINFKNDISQNVDLSDQDLPETLKLKVSSLGSRSSLKQRVDIKNIHLPEKAAVVYTSLNIQ